MYTNYFSNIPAGECVWIGASTYNDRKYRWIELPPNYGSLAANGKLLNNTYSNFAQGINLSILRFDLSKTYL